MNKKGKNKKYLMFKILTNKSTKSIHDWVNLRKKVESNQTLLNQIFLPPMMCI
jgi:hypothetical protein